MVVYAEVLWKDILLPIWSAYAEMLGKESG